MRTPEASIKEFYTTCSVAAESEDVAKAVAEVAKPETQEEKNFVAKEELKDSTEKLGQAQVAAKEAGDKGTNSTL